MTPRVRQLSAFVLVVAVVAVPSSALARPAAPPIKRYGLPSFGVSFAVPASWNAYDYRDPGFRQKFGGAFAQSYIKFAAVNPKREQGFSTSLNVAITAAAAGMTLRESARIGIVPFRRDPTVTIVGSPSNFVRLPGGQAWRLRVRFAGAANGGGTSSLLQYSVLRNRHLYIFSYSTLQLLESKYAATFDDSARSIRFSG
jgi:hypothetical protein